ncbi:hypothetical protein HMPREF0653_00412 [Prevotella disiens JCM 6334 = ATCC 29426]|uniref:Uncharacterized protein n=1 Tax=Prevotella disiens JCM 6334 = ATCC 29426 TaxID=1235811 RepID=A0ABN0NUS3_9BACT|nr:hypothetical protein HMPREF0653_00412 [Prevotella disiens JCM 6334 = ATCC 29426]
MNFNISDKQHRTKLFFIFFKWYITFFYYICNRTMSYVSADLTIKRTQNEAL